MMVMITILQKVIENTPVYVWVLLVVMIMRGRMSSRDGVLSLPKSFLFPAIFLVWGLETVVNHFGFPAEAISAYVVLAAVGAPAGFGLYSHFRSYYQKNGKIWRTGTYLPLIIMMANFLVKYILNVAMAVNHGYYDSMGFNVFYSMTSGFALGLSLGGVVQAYKAVKEYGRTGMSAER